MTTTVGAAKGSFPLTPNPVEIEIELTNRCNAACVACPRANMPVYGRMTSDTIARLLDLYDEYRPRHPLNVQLGTLQYPRITFAGGGEPLGHPDAIPMISYAHERGYEVLLITNASMLNEKRIDQLLATGISTIYCSFWGITEEEYEASMKLPYRKTLAKVLRLAERAAEAGVALRTTLVHVPEIKSSPDEIRAFWAEHGIEVDLNDNNMWNRAGLLDIPPETAVKNNVYLPDVERRIWCADLYFTDAWTWDGRCVLCSCNYFHHLQFSLTDVDTSVDEIGEIKRQLFADRPIPKMCQVCLQPRKAQSAWLAEPWRPLVGDDEWRMVTYAD